MQLSPDPRSRNLQVAPATMPRDHQVELCRLAELLDSNPLESSFTYICIIKNSDFTAADDIDSTTAVDQELEGHASRLLEYLPVIKDNPLLPLELRRRWLGQVLAFDYFSGSRMRDTFIAAYEDALSLPRPLANKFDYTAEFSDSENHSLAHAEMALAYAYSACNEEPAHAVELEDLAGKIAEQSLLELSDCSCFVSCYVRWLALKASPVSDEQREQEMEAVFLKKWDLTKILRQANLTTDDALLMQQSLETDIASDLADEMLDYPFDTNLEEVRRQTSEIEHTLDKLAGLVILPHSLGTTPPMAPQMYFDTITLRCILVQNRIFIGDWEKADSELEFLLSHYSQDQEDEDMPENIDLFADESVPIEKVLATLSEPEPDEFLTQLLAMQAVVTLVKGGDSQEALQLLAEAALGEVPEMEELDEIIDEPGDPEPWYVPMLILNAAGWGSRQRGDLVLEMLRPTAERCEHLFRQTCPETEWAWD